MIDNEATLVSRFGYPSNYNAETWFTAANFLSYGGELWVSRAGDITGNTVTKVSAVLEDGNTYVTMSDTTGLLVGMKLFTCNSNAIHPQSNGGVKITQVVNATAIRFSTPATDDSADSTLVFREDVVFSAIAQETADDTIDWDNQTVDNHDDYGVKDGGVYDIIHDVYNRVFDVSVQWIAKYPGDYGNSLRVCQCDTADQFYSNTDLSPNSSINSTATFLVANVGSNVVTITVTPTDLESTNHVTAANVVAGAAHDSLQINDIIALGNTRIGYQFLKVQSIGTVTETDNVFTLEITMQDEFKLAANCYHESLERYWEHFNLIQVAPGQSEWQTGHGNTAANDELHVVVIDELGKFTTNPGTVLEVYKSLSRAKDAEGPDGTSNYYKDVINQKSQFIWWANDRVTARSNTAPLLLSSTATKPYDVVLYGGDSGPDEAHVSLAQLTFAYDLYKSAEDVDIGLVLTGKNRGLTVSSNTQLATYLIQNIAEDRKDCVVFCSPDKNLCVNNKGNEAVDIVAARNTMPSSSYGFMDSGYKYQYDRYNDIYRWIPLNGDMAGLATRTDATNDPWWSFAGYNRGQLKNVVKLAWNPKLAERNILYAAQVNPVIKPRQEGTILYGDKTMQVKPSAFDRINVRRLFIVLEKAIATAAKYTLFEFNDEFTRSQFKAMVNPFLKDVQGRRGIIDFLVVCDGTNNTPEVIDRNEFKAAMYIKPARSINWVILDFVAVRTGVAFSEVVGKYGG